MLFLRGNDGVEQDVWSARACVDAETHEVLQAITDPAAIAAWAPVSFEVEDLEGNRLRAGSRARVTGSLAGIRVTFEVEVLSADSDGLELVASGPVSFDVRYVFSYDDSGLVVDASVRLRRQAGLTAHILQAAVTTLLNAGALESALGRLETALGRTAGAELLAA